MAQSMLRSLYRRLLCLHPPAFRQRFAEEMLWIFDEAAGHMERWDCSPTGWFPC